MTKFVAKKNLLVLSKSVKQTKKGVDGSYKEYGSISLYDKDADEFFKITIFDNFNNVLSRYDVLKSYNMEIQVSIFEKDGKSLVRMGIL